jgi:hypothetical protein
LPIIFSNGTPIQILAKSEHLEIFVERKIGLIKYFRREWEWKEEMSEIKPCNVSAMQNPPKHFRDNATNETWCRRIIKPV